MSCCSQFETAILMCELVFLFVFFDRQKLDLEYVLVVNVEASLSQVQVRGWCIGVSHVSLFYVSVML